MRLLSQVNIPNSFNSPWGQTKGFGDLISLIIRNSIVIAGLVMIALIIGGGIAIIKSAGNSEEAAKGKQTATTGFIGFVIVFSTYWIIQIIQIITGVSIFNTPL